jgi:outer membrane autotransporter protein
LPPRQPFSVEHSRRLRRCRDRASPCCLIREGEGRRALDRTELGTWLDWSIPVDDGTTLSLRGRAAWAHDNWSAPNITAGFQALPGSIFVVTGAAPATDLALASAGVEIGFRNGFSVGARFDGEFAENSTKYSGMGRLRYTW